MQWKQRGIIGCLFTPTFVKITRLFLFGRYTNTEILPEKIHALRELCRHRFYVVDTASDIKRKVIALLDQVFPEYEKLFTDTFGVTSMQLLENYSQTLADLLQKASRGRFGIILASSSLSLIIKQYIEQLKSLESTIDIFDTEIAKIYDTFDCKLHTITGIGKTLATVIFSEIGCDISKFSSVPKLVAYAGLYPKTIRRIDKLKRTFV